MALLQSKDIVVEEFEVEPAMQGIGIGTHFLLHIKGKHCTHADVMRMVNECSGQTMIVEM
ncbi:MAG: hypothetical protein BWY11_00098 [Firmicutes bacterium ADurb.Bin182]|nr:MAG: hypothetical protein BWY11_00098 [Firmicutes bacterium ADurb.Bin182]